MPMGDEPCPCCGARCFPKEQKCPECGQELSWENPTIAAPSDPGFIKVMEKKNLLGLCGSLVLFVGVFTPIVSVPVVGNVNYFQNGHGDGVIILVLAIISLLLTLSKKFGALWFTGLASLGLLLFTFLNLQTRISEMKTQMESGLAGNPFRGIADIAVQSIQIQWGWAVMLVGAGLVISAAALRKPLRYFEEET